MRPLIITDASSDLPLGYVEENKIPYLGLNCFFKEREYEDDFGKTLKYKDFYNSLREGEFPSTSQVNEYKFYNLFKELSEDGKAIIYIGMSSGLSGTYNSAKLAKETLEEENNSVDITVIDTKCASIGQGILVKKAVDMVETGASKEEIISFIEENIKKMYHWFIVEDLNHLKRGGRISASKAVIGSIFNINPLIFLESDGTLKNEESIRGRKRAIRTLVDKFEKNYNPSSPIEEVGISHGDCLEDALFLKEILEKEFKLSKVTITEMGIGLGAHCGAGILSLCFSGKEYRW